MLSRFLLHNRILSSHDEQGELPVIEWWLFSSSKVSTCKKFEVIRWHCLLRSKTSEPPWFSTYCKTQWHIRVTNLRCVQLWIIISYLGRHLLKGSCVFSVLSNTLSGHNAESCVYMHCFGCSESHLLQCNVVWDPASVG